MYSGVKKFFKDIYDNYDDRLGFESKVEKLNLEITRLTQQLNGIRLQSSLHLVVGQRYCVFLKMESMKKR